jgi:hypothetical protein
VITMKRERTRNESKKGEDSFYDVVVKEKTPASIHRVCRYSESSSTSSLVTGRASSYSTFSSTKPKPQFTQQSTFYRSLCSFVQSFIRQKKGSPEPGNFQKAIDQNDHLTTSTWKAIIFCSVAIAIIAFLHNKAVNYRYTTFMPAEWHWDHNIYIPKESSGEVASALSHKNAPVSLITQVVPGAALRNLEEISSQPNRAYARQWGLDFARYNSGRSSYNPRSCFEKVAVLNAILDKQSNTTSDVVSLWSHNPNVQYDSILLLPPDSIVMELDTNIISDILPQDKLVAIAGWNHNHKLNSNSDVIAFNLNHRHAEAVARLWLEMVSPSQVTCGANNDLGMLVTAVALVMEESEKLDDLIEPLSESKDGFVGNRVIKNIPSSLPGPRSALLTDSLQESSTLLQQTADSVCYRFYPRCEVLT